MRNPFKRSLKDKVRDKNQASQKPLHMPPEGAAGITGNSSNSTLPPGQTRTAQPGSQPAPAVTTPRRPPQVGTEQTMEFLKKVEPDDILELLYPRLVTDQKTRLEACTAELEEIDKELTRLHLMRDDVLNTQAQQSNGVTNF